MMDQKATDRVVYAADAIEWLKAHESQSGTSFVASLPDFSEFSSWSLQEWKTWFIETAKLILEKTPPDGVTLFFQSDIKFEGEWIDKGYLVSRAADELGHSTLFHKVFCRAAPGCATYGKPAYSHLLAFSRTIRPDVARSTPDVIPDLGDKAWVRGMGYHACRAAIEFIQKETRTHTVINPFCGMGSVLAVANSMGLHAIGIEKSPKRVLSSRKLQVDAKGLGFTDSKAERPV